MQTLKQPRSGVWCCSPTDAFKKPGLLSGRTDRPCKWAAILQGNSLEWHFVRQVDYVSACSLLVRRRAWEQVGGFDIDYHPAYYEDVDLCLALRESGYQISWSPGHGCGITSRPALDELVKTFLFKRNQDRLQRKWADTSSMAGACTAHRACSTGTCCVARTWRSQAGPDNR